MVQERERVDSSDEKRGRKSAKREKLARLQKQADLKAVLASPAGRRFMWRLLGDTGIFARIFHENPSVVAYREGRRSLGIDLLDELQYEFHEEYFTMEREALQNAKKATEPEGG